MLASNRCCLLVRLVDHRRRLLAAQSRALGVRLDDTHLCALGENFQVFVSRVAELLWFAEDSIAVRLTPLLDV